MREDLVGGLRNALERGVPLEAAIQSFVTAGYKDSEVREAVRDLDTGSVYIEQGAKPAPNLLNRPAQPVQPLVQRPLARPQPQVQYQPPKPQQGHGSVILVTVLSIVLVLSVAAFIASILFREQIAAFFA
jgi:hypothetical protein